MKQWIDIDFTPNEIMTMVSGGIVHHKDGNYYCYDKGVLKKKSSLEENVWVKVKE